MAKKNAKKKAAKRKTTKKAAGGSLRRMTTGELSAELQRRSRNIAALETKRDALLNEADAIDAEIALIRAAMGEGVGSTSRAASAKRVTRRPVGRPKGSGSGRKRPRNTASLEVSLSKVLKGKTMGVSEAAVAVKKAGYKTSSPNFRTIVNQTLIRSDLIKKVGRGKYTAK